MILNWTAIIFCNASRNKTHLGKQNITCCLRYQEDWGTQSGYALTTSGKAPNHQAFRSQGIKAMPAEVVWNLLWATAIPISWTDGRPIFWWKISCVAVGYYLILFPVFHLPGKDCFLKILKKNLVIHKLIRQRSKFPAGGKSRFHQHSCDEHSSTQLHLTVCGSGQHFRTRWRMDMRCTTSNVSNVKSIIYKHL